MQLQAPSSSKWLPRHHVAASNQCLRNSYAFLPVNRCCMRFIRRNTSTPAFPQERLGAEQRDETRTTDGSKPPAANGKRSGVKNSPPQGDPGGQRPQDRVLASALAYSGTLGTIAAILAWFLHVDMFGTLKPNVNDVYWGLGLCLPIYLANIVIMWPQYSTWRLPKLPTNLQVNSQMSLGFAARYSLWTVRQLLELSVGGGGGQHHGAG